MPPLLLQTSSITTEPMLIVFSMVGLIVTLCFFLSPFGNKGEFGEWFTSKRVLGKLNSLWYSIHDDLYLPRPDGRGTTQIDHVVVSPYGIFVIETKNMKGWIFGDIKSKQWTQCIYGKKYRFQNPLHQNSLHLNALALFLELPRDKMTNIVFFFGDATLKTDLPANVRTSGLRTYIEGFQKQILSSDQCEQIRRRLESADPGENRKAIQKQHLQGIRERTIARTR